MPLVNIYFTTNNHQEIILSHVDELKDFIAKQLCHGETQLRKEEISTRLLRSPAGGMIAEMELEIFAYAFKERIEKQDDICRAIRNRLLKNIPELKDVRVWLVLSDLGHSW